MQRKHFLTKPKEEETNEEGTCKFHNTLYFSMCEEEAIQFLITTSGVQAIYKAKHCAYGYTPHMSFGAASEDYLQSQRLVGF